MTEPGVLPTTRTAAFFSRAERRGRWRSPIPRVLCWSPGEGMIINASRSGLCIAAQQPIQPGASVFLTLKLTGRKGRILGHARWCRPGTAGEGEPALFHTGVELTSPLEESWLTALMRPSRADRLRLP